MLLTYPLDLARTRQGGQVGKSRYHGLSRTLVLTAKEEGIRSLYRGAGLITQITSPSAFYFPLSSLPFSLLQNTEL